jgi:flagellar biosynthesis/type III secretory pathway chaperone
MSEHSQVEATLIDAAETLCGLLEVENSALRRMDIPAATQIVDAKRIATDRLAAAQLAISIPYDQAIKPHAARLRELGLENRRLLERAIVAQDRVLACIARAIPRALAGETGYGVSGAEARRLASRPVALSSRA